MGIMRRLRAGCCKKKSKKIHNHHEASTPKATAATASPLKPVLDFDDDGVLRVKLVLTKAELAMLLSSGAGTAQELLEHLAGKTEGNSRSPEGSAHGGWRPGLESIAE